MVGGVLTEVIPFETVLYFKYSFNTPYIYYSLKGYFILVLSVLMHSSFINPVYLLTTFYRLGSRGTKLLGDMYNVTQLVNDRTVV